MKVMVFGTSNSLLKCGWVAGLRESGVSVDNWSIGMSPSTRFFAYANNDLTQYDFVFFDSVPNDEVLNNEMGSEDFRYNQLKYIFKTIAAQTKLVVIGFTWKGNLNTKSSDFILHKKVAEEVGASFIDVSKFLNFFNDLYRLGLDLLYEEHHAHPQSAIAFRIGFAIGASISDSEYASMRPAFFSNDQEERHKHFGFDSEIFDRLQKVNRSSSVATGNFAVLEAYDDICFPFGNCVGFYINLAYTNGVITFFNSSDPIHSLQLYMQPNVWGSFLKVFIPVPGIKCDRISIGSDPTSVISRNRYSAAEQKVERICLEISDICFTKEAMDSFSDISSKNNCIDLENSAFEYFCHDKNLSKLDQARNEIYKSAFSPTAQEKVFDFCKILEAFEPKYNKTLQMCYDFGIENFASFNDELNMQMFMKEKLKNLLKNQNWNEADKVIEKFRLSYSQNVWPNVMKARALSAAGMRDEALSEWKKVILLNPSDKEAIEALNQLSEL